MVDGGLGAASRRQQTLDRALSASTFLPTFAFAALGTVTVILVALMGMSQLGVGPSARDLGLSVTTPQMSVSITPPPARPSAPASERETRSDRTPAIFTAAVEVPGRDNLVVAAGFTVQRASQATSAVDPEPASKPASKPAPKPAITPSDPPRAQPTVQRTGGAQAFGQGPAFGQIQAFGQGQAFDQAQALSQEQTRSQEQTLSQRQALAADDGAALDDGAARMQQQAKQTTATKALKQTTVTKALKRTKTAKASGHVKATKVHV